MRWTTHQTRATRYHTVGHGEPVVLLADRMLDPAGSAPARYGAVLAADAHLILVDGALIGDGDPAATGVLDVLDTELIPRAHLWAYGSAAGTAYRIALLWPERIASIVIGGFGVETGGGSLGARALGAPALIYVGGRDPALGRARDDATALGAPLAILAGLDHASVYTAVDVVAPLVLSHISAMRGAADRRSL